MCNALEMGYKMALNDPHYTPVEGVNEEDI